MPAWIAFGAVAVGSTVAFVLLARASAATIRSALDAREDPKAPAHRAAPLLESDRLLAGNVLASHGLLLVVLAGTAWVTGVPLAPLGLASISPRTVLFGVGLGVVLAVGNEGAARAADAVGLDRDERLRALLTPDGLGGWISLFGVVLPLVAVTEEVLFRAVLIGGLGAGFGVPAWQLVVVSSIAFGLGHRLQGHAGVIVTTALGFSLGAAFVYSSSLLVVIVAHYLVNALEFLLNEGVV